MKCGKIIIMLVFAVLVLMGIAGAWAGDAGAPAKCWPWQMRK